MMTNNGSLFKTNYDFLKPFPAYTISLVSLLSLLSISISGQVPNTWTSANTTNDHIARHENSFTQLGTKFYLFGGRESAQTLEVYDYQSNTWSTGASAPKQFNHFQALEYEGYIWVVGAFQNNSFPSESPEPNVYLYDPVDNTWIQGPGIPGNRQRGSTGLVIYNDKFYVVCGNTNGHNGGYVNWFDMYDPCANSWTTLPDAPRARDHFNAVVVGNKLYAASGRLSGGPGGTFAPTIPEVDVFDFNTYQWATLSSGSNLPTPRAGTAVVNFQNQVVVMGGEGNGQAYKNVDALDINTNIWQALAPMQHARHGTQAIVSGDGIHITSGSPNQGGGTQTNMEYYGIDNPQGNAITASSLSGPPSVGFGDISSQTITLNAFGGSQGVWVENLNITGPDASQFSIVNGSASNFLIKANDSRQVTIGFNGSSGNAFATLQVQYSGTNKTLSIPLTGAGGTIGESDLELSVSASSSNLEIWNYNVFTITIENKGPDPSANVKVYAPIPSGFAFAGVTTSTGSYDGFFFNWDIGFLDVGAVETLELNLFTLQDQTAVSYFTQVLSSLSEDPDSTPNNNSGSVPAEDDEAVVIVLPPGSGPQDQTITFDPIPDKLTSDAPFSVNATSSSGLPVSLEILSGPATINGTTITLDGTIGTVVVEATQAGDANYNPAGAVQQSFQVTEPQPIDQAITFDPIPDKLTIDAPFAVNAVASSGLSVSFEIISGPATIQGNIITLDGAEGTVVVEATQAGNADYNPALPVQQSFTVSEPGPPQDQTITFDPIPNKQTTDPPFTINATASSGLAVSFDIISGPASINGNTITLNGTEGTVVVEASQDGNAAYNPAPSVQQSFEVIQPAPNTIDLALNLTADDLSLNPWVNINITATLTNSGFTQATGVAVSLPLPSGFAYVSHDAQQGVYNNYFEEWNIAALDPGATATMTLTLFVLQPPNPYVYFSQVVVANETDSDSTPNNNSGDIPVEDDEAAITFGDAGGPQDQIISFAAIADKLTTDPPFVISASSTSGLPVSFTLVSGPATFDENTNTVTLTGAEGTVVIDANQAGNADFNPAPTVTQSFQVNEPQPLDQTINFSPIPNKITTDPPFIISATASSGLSVSFEVISGPASVNGSSITLDGTPGTVVVEATQAGNSDYNPATPVQQSFTVSEPGQPQDQTITFPPIGDKLTTDAPFQIVATASSGLIVSYDILSGPATINGDIITLDGTEGTVVVEANQTGNAEYNPAPPVQQSFEVSEPANDVIDLELDVTADDLSLTSWTNVTFTFTLDNKGSIAATNIVVSVPIPDGFAFTGQNEQQGIYNNYFEEWEIPSINAGATATMELTLFVLQPAAPYTYFTQVIEVDQNDQDSAPNNNSTSIPVEDDEASVVLGQVAAMSQLELDEEGERHFIQKMIEKLGVNDYEELRLNQIQMDDIKLFPNPASRSLYLDLRVFQGKDAFIQVIDLLGRVHTTLQVNEVQVPVYQLDIETYEEGMYLLNLRIDNEHQYSKKFLIQR